MYTYFDLKIKTSIDLHKPITSSERIPREITCWDVARFQQLSKELINLNLIKLGPFFYLFLSVVEEYHSGWRESNIIYSSNWAAMWPRSSIERFSATEIIGLHVIDQNFKSLKKQTYYLLLTRYKSNFSHMISWWSLLKSTDPQIAWVHHLYLYIHVYILVLLYTLRQIQVTWGPVSFWQVK